MIPICGIFGIAYAPGGAARERHTPAEIAQRMFPASVHRGRHAFGFMYCPSTNDEVQYYRNSGRADSKVAHDESANIPDDVTWLVGHVRHATTGDPRHLQNNHPIRHHDVIGVHNGVVRNYRKILEETGRWDDSVEVDSEAIFAAVSRWGMRAGLHRLDADMVTVFADLNEPQVLRIGRSFGRPLVYATTEAGNLIFASEPGIIEAADIPVKTIIDMTGRRFVLYTVRDGRIVSRSTYRARKAEEPTFVPPAPSRTGTRSGNPLSGITDRMSGSSYWDPPTSHAAARQAELLRPTARRDRRSTATPVTGRHDRYGGLFIGNNRYRLPDGAEVGVEEYVDWCVDQSIQAARERVALEQAIERGDIDLS